MRVVLVERNSLAAGASGRNHGLLLMPTDPGLAPMARLALRAYLELAEDPPLPLPLEGDPLGILIVAAGAEEREDARAEAEAAKACGVAIEQLAADALSEAEPRLAPDLEEGWLLDDGRLVDPASLTVALALQARQAGAQIIRNLPVRSLVMRGDAVRGVATEDGPIEAATVVVAAGPWCDRLLRPIGIHLPVIPARGWLVHMGPAPGMLRHVVEGAGWHALPGDDPMPPVLAGHLARGTTGPLLGSLLQQNPDGTVLAGSSRQAAHSSDPEDPEIPREIARRAIRLVPDLEEVRVLGSWSGLRPMTPDALPIIGTLREGLVVATGHGSFGVTLAGGTAPLVVSAINGTEPRIDPEPFRPDRFPLSVEPAPLSGSGSHRL
jgi:D-hydroxyproline dehydrogenase subunit beta